MHDCHISNFDGKQSSRMMESAENGTTAEELIPAVTVYETNFYQPGYFNLILVRVHEVSDIGMRLRYFLQDLAYGIVDPLPYQFIFTLVLEVISYICLVMSLVHLTFHT